jgi:hypothetical protein
MSPHFTIMEPLCRGLVCYISYLSACQTNTVYSEYLLYEPILLIAHAHGYDIRCEVPVEKVKGEKGDNRRIDFLLRKGDGRLCIEVKWIKTKTVHIERDVTKLLGNYSSAGASGYVLLFGRSSLFKKKLGLVAAQNYISKGKLVEWQPGRTKYSARWFRYC